MDFIQKIIEMFSHTIKFKYMSLNFEMELPVWDGNGHVLSCSVLYPVLIWNNEQSNNVGSQMLVSQKLFFFLSPSMMHLISLNKSV